MAEAFQIPGWCMPDERAQSAAWKRGLGKRIALARQHASEREKLEISQAVLASRLRMFPKRLWEIENGLLSIDALEISRIARALNVHPGFFYDQRGWCLWETNGCANDATWILAKSISELGGEARFLLEQLVAQLGNSQTKSLHEDNTETR